MASAGCSRSVIQGHGFWTSLPSGIGSTQCDDVCSPVESSLQWRAEKERIRFYDITCTEASSKPIYPLQLSSLAIKPRPEETSWGNASQPEMISVQWQVLLTKPRSGVIFTLQQTENEKIEHGFPFGADKRYLIEFVQHGIRSVVHDKTDPEEKRRLPI